MGRNKNCGDLRGGGNRTTKLEERSTKSLLKKAKEKVAHAKKKEIWRKDLQRFKEQLHATGFDLKEIPGDGNCLFRALGDQVEGAQDKHEHYRARVVSFIKDNREQFEPFIIDMSFDAYCKQMSTLGTWGGNIELQAASLALQVNITVHQLDHPQWQIVNFFEGSYPMINLSYHDGQHYNSLRPFVRMPEAKPSAGVQKALNAGKQQCLDKEKENKVKIAMQSTGYTDREVVTEVLRDCEFDLDAAIEILISMKQIDTIPERVEETPSSVPETSQVTSASSKQSSPTSSPSASLIDDASLLSHYIDDLSLYDEEQALAASLLEYQLSLAQSATTSASSTTPTTTTTTTTTTTSTSSEPTSTDKPPRPKKKDIEEVENRPAKQRPNKKAGQKAGGARKLSNKERKLANKKAQEEIRKEQKKLEMQRLMDELQIPGRDDHYAGDDIAPSLPVVDLGVVLI
eukprot:TRINITY_DN2887_c0_g1_i1.p1 TRINITY_DN2887_c0_g1~~TRINITY_DN2887_c0_g1_i1.p1  ORF type:complete len:458 (+),score=135.73 TRINITY_DN2887_c0_g1_i1:165-1538(+)